MAKRISCFLLAVMMAVSMLPAPAFAEDAELDQEAAITEAAEPEAPAETETPASAVTEDSAPAVTEAPADAETSEEVEASTSFVCAESPTANALPENVHSHSYSVSESTSATCTDDGSATYTCSCGDSYTETIAATGHNWVHHHEDEVGHEVVYMVCHCGWSSPDFSGGSFESHLNAVEDPWNHSYYSSKSWVVDSPARDWDACSVCGATENMTVAHTHSYSVSSSTPATCTDDGSATYTCSCGDSYTETIAATGHNWVHHHEDEVGHQVVYAVCHCGWSCPASSVDSSFKAHANSVEDPWNHSYYESIIWVVDSPARDWDTCTVCGCEVDHVHQYTAVCVTAQTHELRCSGCGSVVSEAHTMRDYTCTVCGYQAHRHTCSGWVCDEATHCIYCTDCGDLISTEDHDGDPCTVCGYSSFNGYTVNFVANAPEATGSTEPLRFEKGTANLTANGFARPGYKFAGWNTKANGSGTSYADKASVTSKAFPKGSKELTLYAKWTKIKYTITYNLNKGTNSSKNPASYYVTTADITLAKPTRKGYTFKGWFDNAEFTGDAITGIPKGSTDNMTLYAKWEKTNYTITYNLNGGENSEANPDTYTITTATITLANPTRTGYTFKGWFSNSTFKTQVKTIAKGSTGNKTLYAKWAKTKYTITYKLNGGTNSSKNPASYYITTADINLLNPTRKGYTFQGWVNSEGEAITGIPKGSYGNVTLYAQWEENSYTIVFSANKGTGEMESMENVAYSEKVTLTANSFTRSGYKFAGWNTKANGSGTTYANKAAVSKLTSTDGKTVTLYAQWKKK